MTVDTGSSSSNGVSISSPMRLGRTSSTSLEVSSFDTHARSEGDQLCSAAAAVTPTTRELRDELPVKDGMRRTFKEAVLASSIGSGSPVETHAKSEGNQLCSPAPVTPTTRELGDEVLVNDGMRRTIKEAVLGDSSVSAASPIVHDANEILEPVDGLMCPISYVRMMTDPVVAADGHTYERAAIAAWFAKQQSEVDAAQEELQHTPDSQRAKAIVQRGVVSPMTSEKMENLELRPNLAVFSLQRTTSSRS